MLVLFAGSGSAALIYEIVWFQLLQLTIGSSAISLGMLLAAYMGGMCLGSIALPRFVSAGRHPLRVYAWLELGIGVLGITVLFCVPYVDRIYVAGATPGITGIVLRGVISAVCLLPPTILMGASLPAMARWVRTTPQGVSWLGFFYGGNLAGAVFGVLLVGFYLLRVHDVVVATYVAVAINAVAALIAFGLAKWTPYQASTTEDFVTHNPNSTPVYIAIALSGLCALGAEVIWTRLLSLMLGATVYTFSIILAVFLVGLGAGSSIGSFLTRQIKQPRTALAYCQIVLAAAIAWTAYTLTNAMPYWPVDPWISTSPWFIFQIDLLRCFGTIFPATFMWGLSFPLALAAVALPGQDAGRVAGAVYAANTAGAIIGAMLFSLLLIPWVGTQQSQRVLIGVSALTALILFAPRSWRLRPDANADTQSSGVRVTKAGVAWALLLTGFSIILVWSVSDIPWQVVAFGRRTAPTLRAFQLYPGSSATVSTRILYRGEGMNTAIVIAEENSSQRTYYVNGKSQASHAPLDMRLQRMLGHLPALVHPNPRSVLTVGFGAGVTAGSFVVHPEVDRIVICEIESLVPPVATEFFSVENHNVLHDRRTQMIYDDARHYVLTTQETFDIITSDPLDPWIKGTAALYTREFFEVFKQHLKPGGVAAVFVQLYESSEEAVRSEIATFFDVFPDATIWSNYQNGEGYDLVLLGQRDAAVINVDEMQERLNRPDYERVTVSLREAGFRSAVELLATYAGRASDLSPWLKDAQINRDLNLRLQYVAGLGLNTPDSAATYRDLIKYRHFPEDLFAGSSTRLLALRSVLNPVGPATR
jgi:spermidine synthase